MVSHLLLQARLILREHGTNGGQTDLFTVKVYLKVICAGELVGHFVFHLLDLFCHLLHLFFNPTLKGLDLIEVILPLLELYLKSCIGSLSIFDLPLLEGKLIFLIFILGGRWQIVLTNHGALHVLQQCRDRCLMFVDLALISGLVFLELLHEFADFSLLLVEDLVLLGLAIFATSGCGTRLLLLQVLLDLFDVPLIGLNHLSYISDILLLLLDLGIVLLDAVEQALTCLGEGQIHLVGLELQVILPLQERGPLFLEMLGPLLEGVLLEARLSLDQAGVDLLQLGPAAVDLALEATVLLLQALVLVPLLRIQIVQLALVGHVDVLDLLLDVRDLVLHVTLLSEDLVEVLPLLVILVLDVHEEGLDVLRLGIRAILVECQVVVSELALVLADILNQGLILPLESHVGLVVLVDLLHLRLHLVDLIHDLRILTLQQVVIVVSIVDLSARPSIAGLQALNADTMVGNGSLDDINLGILSDPREVRLSVGSGTHAHGCGHPRRIIVSTAHLHALRCWNTSVHL